VRPVGFTIEIYYDARPYEFQIMVTYLATFLKHRIEDLNDITFIISTLDEKINVNSPYKQSESVQNAHNNGSNTRSWNLDSENCIRAHFERLWEENG